MQDRNDQRRSTLEYQPPSRPAERDVNPGFVSVCFLLCIPLAMVIPVLLLPILPVAAATGLFAIVDSRGRSILGWIGFTISGALIALIAISMLTGR